VRVSEVAVWDEKLFTYEVHGVKHMALMQYRTRAGDDVVIIGNSAVETHHEEPE
jgi:hypothetical protein